MNAPPRLQRLLLRLNNYNTSLQWIPGKKMVFADHISRNIYSKESNEPTCKGLDIKVEDAYLSASEDRCLSLAKETDKDDILVALKNTIVKGWPDKRDECPMNLRDFWSYRDELSILDGLVLKGTRLIIPNKCQDELLEKLHEGHFGVECTRLRARDNVFWLGINKDIETLIKTCEKCRAFKKK